MKRAMLPLNALRAFEAAARHGRMVDAAAELGVTHSAVSRQIKSLENLLGARLFEGPRNRPLPTEAARRLLPELTQAFDAIGEAVARVALPERRVLDISCLGTLSMRLLIPRLFDFQVRHPDIEVRLTANDTPVDFRRHRVDAAIRVGSGEWNAAEAVPLFDDWVGPVLSPKIVQDKKVDHKLLCTLPRLHTATRPDAWQDWSKRFGVPFAEGGQSFEHFYFMLEAATAGLGVAIAPEVLVRDELAAGGLIAPFGFTPNGLTYTLLLPSTATPDARIFTNWLVEAAAGERDSRRESKFDVAGDG